MNRKKATFLLGAVSLFPVIASAIHFEMASCYSYVSYDTGIGQYICTAIHLIGLSIPVIFALSIIFFFYGMMKFIIQAGNDKERESGKLFMVWGVIILFVAASVWGFVKLIGNVVGVSQGGMIRSRVMGPP